ncbi:hypothetical protein [Nocardioides terrigena]|uniref:hypothetical protein n=1 Tax=Nocardioides terrigena TaxID=424797 RepID=UPI000D31C333|nr:hypothetical protein [Nocardioides terrigena]
MSADDLGHGFELALDHYPPVRPAAKNLLTPNSLGKLKLGMTDKKARSTGYIKPGMGACGPPVLKRKRRGYVGWRRGRVSEVSAFLGTNLNTRRGVGPGSMVTEMQQRHPRMKGPFVTPVLSDTGTLWVYLQRSKRGVLVLVLDGSASADRAPVGADLIRSIFCGEEVVPKVGLASGC